MSRVLVVAEPGCTHEGSLSDLMALVDMAAESGADAFKPQFMSDPEAVAARRSAPDYLPFYQWLRYPVAWLEALRIRCAGVGLKFGCTVYLPQDVEAIDPFVDFYKVSSFEAETADMLKAYADAMSRNEKRLVVSLGLGAKPTAALHALDAADVDGARIDALHCVSAYPTPHDQLNLSSLRENFLAGVSDHTLATHPDSKMVGALAVAAGARIVERHVRLSTCRPSNPDYPVSMTVHEFTAYVRDIRTAETMRGEPGMTGPMPAEEPMLQHRAASDAKKAAPAKTK